MSKKLILKIKSTIIHVRLMAWHNRFKQRKACKKDISKEAWHVYSIGSNKMVGLVLARR